jgi:hypothetical protein
MPGDFNLLSVTDSAASDKISLYVYQAILEIQQPHPEWLKEKYRKVAWQDARHQFIFLKRLKNILQALTIKNPGSAILISILGSVFYKQHGQTISKTLDRLKLNGNFPKFLQSCRSFKLGQTAKGWQVAIAYP